MSKKEYKLINALPQSLPGNTEDHYGYKCEVRQDGIYIVLDDISAANFAAAGRISPMPKEVKVAPEPEKVPEVIETEKPQTMKDVVENGSPARKAKTKAQ